MFYKFHVAEHNCYNTIHSLCLLLLCAYFAFLFSRIARYALLKGE
ncbi:hypothetical protein HMPREF9419_0747 [Prevotella nigrescens ATCC 33563]|nr:hypothetical protein HMPREF9419_0747 [Prevotella nigrescens ATCC 33563]